MKARFVVTPEGTATAVAEPDMERFICSLGCLGRIIGERECPIILGVPRLEVLDVGSYLSTAQGLKDLLDGTDTVRQRESPPRQCWVLDLGSREGRSAGQQIRVQSQCARERQPWKQAAREYA